MMFALMRSLLSRKAKFYSFENRILIEVKSRLDAESGERLQRQIDVINKIQRLSNGKEVNLYQVRNGKAAFDESLRFPTASSEALLATINLADPTQRTQLKAEVWLAKGRLFSLLFNQPPKYFFGPNWPSAQPEIADVKIWFNPMHPQPTVADEHTDVAKLIAWLQEWNTKGTITDLCTPLPESKRAEYLASIDARLPLDYLDLVAQTDGVKLATCIVNGLKGIRKVIWPDANYYIVAEIEGLGVLAVKEGERRGMLYMLDYENNDAIAVGKSLRDAIANLPTSGP